MLPILVGALVSRFADAQAEDRKRRLMEAMLRYQHGQSAVGQQAIGNLMTGMTPEARAAEMASTTADRAGSLRKTVDAVQASNPPQIAGKLSGDFTKAQATAADTVAARTKKVIEQLSTMGAPGETGLAQGIRFGRAAGTVDSSNTAIGNVGNAYMHSINNTVPNPYMKMGGNALMAYGAGGGKFGGAATDQPTQLSGDPDPNAIQNTYSTPARTRRTMSLWGR